MSNSSSNPSGPRIPWGLSIFAVIGFVFAVGYLMTQTGDETKADVGQNSDGTEVTQQQARRIGRILADSKNGPPIATSSRGIVVDVSENQITVDVEGVESTWPLASDVEIWKNRQGIEADQIAAGDLVDIHVQQLGSRSNGWINAVVLVNVAASDEMEADSDNPVSVGSQSISGAIVEIQTGVIVVADDEGRKSSLPLASNTSVIQNSTPIPIASLSPGTKVILRTSEQGSVADGWISVVDEIKIQSENGDFE